MKRNFFVLTKLLKIQAVVAIIILLGFISVGTSSPIQASDALASVKFEHITTSQGLPNDVVYSILQDKQGFMWFSGEGGLIRYDGYNIKVYQNDPLDPASIASNNISQILEDQDGAIWCSTWGAGVDRFDPQTESITHYKNDPANQNSLSDNRAHVIYQDRSGILWFGTYAGGLNRFDPDTQTFTHFQHSETDPHSLSQNRVWSVVEDQSGNLWVGTNNGLNRLDQVTGQFTHYKNAPDNPRSLSNNEARWMYIDHAGTMWVSTDGGLNRYDAASDDFTRYVHDPDNPASLSNNIAFKIREDQYNRLWIGTKGVDLGGLNVFDPQTQQFVNYTYDPKNPDSISHNDIRDVFIDRTGVLWIGTRGGGVNKLDLKPEKFQHVTRNPNLDNTLHGTLVFSIAEDATGNLWIGTDGGGLNSYNPSSGLFEYYDMTNSAISNNSVLAIQIDRAGYIWLGTKGGGLNRFDPQTAQFTVYQNNISDQRSLSNDQVYALLQDREGRLWIGTDNGLNLFNAADQTFTRFMSDPGNPNSLSNKSVLSLMQGQNGALWVGTWGGGVNRLVLASSQNSEPKFTAYQCDLNNPNSLSNNEITALLEDQNRNVWIGTNGGLNKLDPVSGICTRYFIEQGLPSNDIAGLLEDETGTLWISTANGLASLNPVPQTFNIYGVADGLQSTQFKDGAAYCSRSGQLFFGGVDGYSYFYPSDIKHNSVAPLVVLTSFKVFEQPVPLQQSVSYLNDIELTYKDKLFSFEFAALDYTHTADNRFAYKLEGFDTDWIYSGQRHYVSYSNLDAGQYVFRVKASNNDGVWNETGLALQITISPPWWETMWFRALTVILLVGAVVVIFRWRTQTLSAQKYHLEQVVGERTRELEGANKRLQEFDKLKSMFIASMSHELRTPLNSIIGFTGILLQGLPGPLNEEQKTQLGMVRGSSRHLLALINDVIDVSKIEAEKIDLVIEDFDLSQLITDISSSFEVAVAEKGLSMHIDKPAKSMMRSDERRVKQIIMNMVSNAVKYTDKGIMNIKLVQSSGKMEISVKDSGVGIRASDMPRLFTQFGRIIVDGQDIREGTGLGLYLSRKLANLLGGVIRVESELGKGSEFTLTLPVNYKGE